MTCASREFLSGQLNCTRLEESRTAAGMGLTHAVRPSRETECASFRKGLRYGFERIDFAPPSTLLVRLANRRIDGPGLKIGHFKNLSSTPSVCAAFASGAKNGIPAPRRLITPIRTRPGKISVHPSLAARPVATMITKECFGCEKVTSHEHLHDCAPGIPETHMVGSERFVCVLCKHVTFAGSDGASRFPFTFDKVAAGR